MSETFIHTRTGRVTPRPGMMLAIGLGAGVLIAGRLYVQWSGQGGWARAQAGGLALVVGLAVACLVVIGGAWVRRRRRAGFVQVKVRSGGRLTTFAGDEIVRVVPETISNEVEATPTALAADDEGPQVEAVVEDRSHLVVAGALFAVGGMILLGGGALLAICPSGVKVITTVVSAALLCFGFGWRQLDTH